jgi:hypothetical protein
MDHLLPKQLYRKELIRIPKRDKLARYSQARKDRQRSMSGWRIQSCKGH